MHSEVRKQTHTIAVLVRSAVHLFAVKGRPHHANLQLELIALISCTLRVYLLTCSPFLLTNTLLYKLVLARPGLFLSEALLP